MYDKLCGRLTVLRRAYIIRTPYANNTFRLWESIMSRVIICVSKSKMISLQKFHHLHCCNFAPPWTTIPDLRILGDIPLYIEFYNETNEELTKGCLAICFGCVSL